MGSMQNTMGGMGQMQGNPMGQQYGMQNMGMGMGQ